MVAKLASNKGDYMKWAISLILGLAFMLIPEGGVFTYSFKVFLAVTVFNLALCAFEIVPVLVPSILMPALWIVFGAAPANIVMSPWLSTMPLMLVGALFLAATLTECGLLRRLAFWMMSVASGNLLVVLIALLTTGAVLNAITLGGSPVIIGALGGGMFLSLGKDNRKLGVLIATACFLGACTAHAYTYQVGVWAIILPLSSAAGLMPIDAITPVSLLIHNWPMFFVSIGILLVIYKMYKPDQPIGEVSYFKDELAKMGKLSKEERNNLIMLIVVLGLVFTKDLHGMDINTVFAFAPWIVYLPFMKGADAKTIKSVMWPMVFFMMSCMSIGVVATYLGFGNAVVDVIQSILAGNTSPYLLLVLIFAIVFALNFLMTPMAIFALIIVPVLTVAANAGFDPIPFAYAVNACSEAIILPYEYTPYLVIYSFGMIKMNDFIKTNVIRSILFFAGFLLVLVPYWMLVGLL